MTSTAVIASGPTGPTGTAHWMQLSEPLQRSRSGGNVIVAVEADDDQYPDRSIYGGTHDCAPEWVEPIEQS